MARKVAFRKKRQNRLGMFLVSVIVLILCSVISVSMWKLKKKQDVYIEKEQNLAEQISKEEQRTKDLVEYEKYTKTSKYVEEVAKDRLELVYGDEIIFESEDGK